LDPIVLELDGGDVERETAVFPAASVEVEVGELDRHRVGSSGRAGRREPTRVLHLV
jgi:hypothetical protein